MVFGGYNTNSTKRPPRPPKDGGLKSRKCRYADTARAVENPNPPDDGCNELMVTIDALKDRIEDLLESHEVLSDRLHHQECYLVDIMSHVSEYISA